MSDQREADNASSCPGTSDSRHCFALGRSLPGRVSLNPPPPPGRLSSLRSRDLTLGGFKKPTVAELFQQLSLSEKEELLFIQLPDTIPGQTESHKDKLPKKDTKPELKQQSQIKTREPVGKDTAPVLSDFSEGLIGKIQIRKSGKVQLALGEVTVDVSEGAAFSFLQQLVSIRLSEGLTGDMSILGNVKHKLVCSPDFEALLEEVKLPQNTHSGNT
ncbi:hypothetical protein JZ751_007825 [Albula glossodonta]|uniref:Uncharacterized protein n=1 Tax=Albula glossodonta TaxID=121402 RepID=A0A8T2P2P4_9TELE|nr:hypothetical protein JZ751_007825 [Albula glossodonta]